MILSNEYIYIHNIHGDWSTVYNVVDFESGVDTLAP